MQWFLIHYGITFVAIHNPAVYLSGARVSISPTLVPRLNGFAPSRNRAFAVHFMIKSFGTDWANIGDQDQTAPRGAVGAWIKVFTVFNSIFIFWRHYSMYVCVFRVFTSYSY